MNAGREPSTAWAALLVGVVAGAVYVTSLANGFAYDDVGLIVNDPRVHSLNNLSAIFGQGYWNDDALGIYRPLTTLSFALDWSLAAGRPAWFHFSNVLLHSAVCVLLLLVLERWFATRAAVAGALLFAVHPVHVEAVANVVGRSEMLVAIAALGAILLWQRRKATDHGRLHVAGVAALFALGLGAKESAVVLLPLLLLADIADGELPVRQPGPWVRRSAGALVLLVAVLVAWLALRLTVLGTITPDRVDAAFDVAQSSTARILTAFQAWPVWANLLFAPVTLLADYGPRVLMPTEAVTPAAAAGAVLAITLCCAGLVAALQQHGRAALALLWFPVTILPVSNLLVPTGVIVAERTLYLPSVAVSIALACGVEAVMRRSAGVTVVRWSTPVLAALLAIFAARTIDRIPAWQSNDALFATLVRDRPDSFRAQWYLARQARNVGDTVTARQRYEAAIALWPFRHRLILEAAIHAGEAGDNQRARDLATHAVSLRPDDLESIRFLAAVGLDLGDASTAGPAIGAGLRLKPDDEILLRMQHALGGLRTELQ